MSLDAQRKSVLERLQKAMDLELATIPPYMMALMSIRPPANRPAADLIRSVMMEEMLHMALVGNLICSLGGRTRLGRENVPSFPLRLTFQERNFSDRKFDIDLRGLTPQQLEMFLKIELPADLHEAFGIPAEGLVVPAPTIGDFYDDLVKELTAMAATYPSKDVFIGADVPQIGPGYYWGGAGEPIVVKTLDDALAALGMIIRQGEGASIAMAAGEAKYFADPKNHGHYFRFMEIFKGRRYKAEDSPMGNPSGEVIQTDFGACAVLKANPKAADYAEGTPLSTLNAAFNRHYSLMLNQIELAFNGNPTLLYEAITNGMHGIAGIAYEMVRTPVPDEAGVFGCPTFEWVDQVSGSVNP
jgi:hypothetical protein